MISEDSGARQEITAGRDAFGALGNMMVKIRNIRIIKKHPALVIFLGGILVGAGGMGIYLPAPAPSHGGENSATAPRYAPVTGEGAGASGQAGVAETGQWADFLAPGTAVICQDDQGTGITLEAISMTDGHTVASRRISLPSGVTQGQSCSGKDETSTFPVRQMFDHTFTHMAVSVSDPASGGQLAAVMNLQTGQVTPVPEPGGFTSAPHQENLQFDPVTQMVWYADQTNGQIGEFAPGAREVKVRGESYSDEVAAANGNFWPITGSNWTISPDGRHIVFTDTQDDFTNYLAGPGAILADVTGINSGGAGVESFGDVSALPGSDSVHCDAPATWLDGTHLLCYEGVADNDSNFGLVTFSAAVTSVTSFRPNLLPSTTDRTNSSAVASPDGKSFAFLSLQGSTLSLCREDLAPGSSTVKIADISTSADSSLPSLVQWN